MRSSGHSHRFRKVISCVRNSRSRRFAATPVSPSRKLKKSWVQMHCDHSFQSSSIRLADEMTTLIVGGKTDIREDDRGSG